ncbi:MAG: aromatic ring-hydroxylating dioxygenase subunit alpha [Bacteroidetes bacterium]|nr:aromatic ring-hydroxylating dioxygenase subunit alpha [Bacteroidota bacterium]
MNRSDYLVDADITRAHTLSSDFYTNPQIFALIKEQLFARSWQCIGLTTDLTEAESVQPFFFMPDFLDEPLLLSRDQNNQLHCLSNVCTHRGNIIAESGGHCSELRCRYHGRRFDLEGKVKSMPQFKDAQDLSGQDNHLPETPLNHFGPLLFTSLNPAFSFEDWIKPVAERLSWIPFQDFQHTPEYAQTYEIDAHWALYIDNYLERFHIPFIHPELNHQLHDPELAYELFDYGSLQLEIAKPGELTFQIPDSYPDSGKAISAYYFWLFPNIMMNVYPWGLSLNLVFPVSASKTQIRCETFIWKEELFSPEAIDSMHAMEIEDTAILELVQKGMGARLYKQGRYSPKMEVAVHHFHRLIGNYL